MLCKSNGLSLTGVLQDLHGYVVQQGGEITATQGMGSFYRQRTDFALEIKRVLRHKGLKRALQNYAGLDFIEHPGGKGAIALSSNVIILFKQTTECKLGIVLTGKEGTQLPRIEELKPSSVTAMSDLQVGDLVLRVNDEACSLKGHASVSAQLRMLVGDIRLEVHRPPLTSDAKRNTGCAVPSIAAATTRSELRPTASEFVPLAQVSSKLRATATQFEPATTFASTVPQPVLIELPPHADDQLRVSFRWEKTYRQLVKELTLTDRTTEQYRAISQLIEEALSAELDSISGFVRVVVAGSFAKGTAVESEALDLDLVCLFAGFVPLQSGDYIWAIEQALRRHLRCGLQMSTTRGRDFAGNSRVLKFSLNGVKIDLLPGGIIGCDVEWPQCLIEDDPSARELWASSFSHKAVEFVSKMLRREPLSQSVIIVAKAWRDSLIIPKAKLDVLPLSTLIELIVIHVLQQAPRRSVRAGFVAFLDALVNYKRLQVIWVNADWFSVNEILPAIRAAQPPTVLDPADPTNNLARMVGDWTIVADLARSELARLQ